MYISRIEHRDGFSSNAHRDRQLCGCYTIYSLTLHTHRYYLDNIEHLYVYISPRVIASDFHFISLVCQQNMHLFSSYFIVTHWVRKEIKLPCI